MSVSSFPRAEHIALLRSRIEEGLRERGLLQLEVAEQGLNQMKCQYRFGIRRRPGEKPASTRPESVHPSMSESTNESINDSASDWTELPRADLAIHFQMAQRLEEGRGAEELDRVLDGFLSRNFPEFSASRDGG